jgi:hypothetical protein
MISLNRMFFLNCTSVGVEESIVNALHRLRTNHGSAVSIYVLHEWCVHSRLFNAYCEVKFKKHPIHFHNT